MRTVVHKTLVATALTAMAVVAMPSLTAYAQNAPANPPAATAPAPAPVQMQPSGPGAPPPPPGMPNAQPPGIAPPKGRPFPAGPNSPQMPRNFPGFGAPQRNVVTAKQLNTPPVRIASPSIIKVTGIAARVGTVAITNQELVQRFLADGGQATLNDMIIGSLVTQEAKKKGIVVSHDEVMRKYAEFKHQMLEQAPPGTTWAQLLSQQSRSDDYAMSQVRLRVTLEKLMAKAVLPADLTGKRHLFHILIPTSATPMPGHASMSDADAKAKIEKIAADIAANKVSFKEAARLYSQDDATKNNGGDLGWMMRGQGLDPNFEKAAFDLKEGEVSGPVKSQFGYHLIFAERFGDHATAADKQAAAEQAQRDHVGQRDMRSYIMQLKQNYAISNLLLQGVPLPPAPAAMGGPMGRPGQPMPMRMPPNAMPMPMPKPGAAPTPMPMPTPGATPPPMPAPGAAPAPMPMPAPTPAPAPAPAPAK